MNIAQRFGSRGLAQKSEQRDHDQQGFQALANQDGEGPQKDSGNVARRIGSDLLRAYQ